MQVPLRSETPIDGVSLAGKIATESFEPHFWECSSLSPLISLESSALNPCFVALVFATASILLGLLGFYQLSERIVFKSRFGGLNGTLQKAKIVLILAQVGIFVAIFKPVLRFHTFQGLCYMLFAAVITIVIFPLHLLETSTSLVQPATLLFYWPVHVILLAVVFVQQSFSQHPLVPGGSKYVQLLGIMNGLAVTLLEYLKFEPNKELILHHKETNMDLVPINIMSRITFSWMNELIITGYNNKALESHDLPSPPLLVTTSYTAPKLTANWKQQLLKGKPSLLLALIKTFGLPVLVSMFFDMGDSLITFLNPQLLKQLIRFFGRDDNPPIIIAFGIAFGMFCVSLVETAFSNQYFIRTAEAGLGIKAALMHLIYDKSMKLSPEARLNRSTGDIVNLMSVDVSRLNELPSYVQTLFSAPLRLVLCLVSLHAMLGNATFAGIVTMLIMMPLNAVLVRSLRKFHREQMKVKDRRTSMVAEIMQNVKSIKLYAWEKPMLERLSEVRNNQELKNLNKIGVLSAVVNFAWTCVPFFVSCSTFAVFAFTSKTPLTPEIVFPALTLFDLLSDPIFAIPALMTAMIESGVSLSRLTSFLLSDEIDHDFLKKKAPKLHLGDTTLIIENCDFFWSKKEPIKNPESYDEESQVDQSKIALKNINFEAKKGELSCIVGRVGTGKSTFLQCLLGELTASPSDATKDYGIEISGSIAYCSQVPWILNATVKENILFGHKFDEEFYEKTILACQLQPDLDILPDGDETLVGEKGISLSGGQKARLSLARAVYMRADIYLLDDILSAVDAHVGQNLISQVLGNDGILATKTRVLATNSIRVLNESKNICLISNYHIAESGSFQQMMAAKGRIYDLVNEFGRKGDAASEEAEDGKGEVLEDENVVTEGTSLSSEDLEEQKRTRSPSHVSLRRASVSSFKKRPTTQERDKTRKTAQKEETKEKGKVSWSVYSRYAKACSYSGSFLVCLLVIVTVALSVSGNYWLKHWAEENDKTGTNADVVKFVAIYALFGISSGLFTLVRAVVMWSCCSIRASKKLHNDMAAAVLRSPMSFFETTPMGRVLNRFSQDMSKIDSALPRVFAAVFSALVKTFFTLVIIGSNMPFFLLIIAGLSVVYVYYQKYYIVTSRDLKRIVSISKSPIFAHIQESLNGADTIRAYGQHGKFLFQNSANIDYNQISAYCFKSVNRWLSTRLQFIGSIVIFSTSTLAILSLRSEHPISSGLLGLIMSYALRVTSSLSFIVKRSVEIESDVVCCERIFEYCELEPEGNNGTTLETAPANWPDKGVIEFKNYSTRYRDNLDPVLRDINICVKAGEKIGIVGRTGSGKSSLVLSIFRVIEPLEGKIEIDNLDTSHLTLFDLRRNLSIIPQDAQCINGSIRYNLDPFGQYSDEQVWKSLKMSRLEDHVLKMAKEQGLEEEPLICKISESGLNLSVGQRQLVCLARVLLKSQKGVNLQTNPSKILILDEATSSVDAETDRIIQETIRSEFKDLTILTIAHRLDTIMDNDRILVLDSGNVKEFERPEVLLEDESSVFYGLCKDGGYAGK